MAKEKKEHCRYDMLFFLNFILGVAGGKKIDRFWSWVLGWF